MIRPDGARQGRELRNVIYRGLIKYKGVPHHIFEADVYHVLVEEENIEETEVVKRRFEL